MLDIVTLEGMQGCRIPLAQHGFSAPMTATPAGHSQPAAARHDQDSVGCAGTLRRPGQVLAEIEASAATGTSITPPGRPA
jgi:hypothetical protein